MPKGFGGKRGHIIREKAKREKKMGKLEQRKRSAAEKAQERLERWKERQREKQ